MGPFRSCSIRKNYQTLGADTHPQHTKRPGTGPGADTQPKIFSIASAIMIQRMGFKGCRDHYRRTCLDRHLRPKKRICVAVRYLLVALAIPFGTYYVIARHPQSCWFTCNFDDGWECHNGISCSCGIARLSNSTCCPFALRLPHSTLMHQSLYLL